MAVVHTFNKTGVFSQTVPKGAKIRIEVYGNKGASSSGGNGGYIAGDFSFDEDTNLQINMSVNPCKAPDVRTGAYTLSDRIIVAGAGGNQGGEYYNGRPITYPGGIGGYPTGGAGTSGRSGRGGTQTAGGLAGSGNSNSGRSGIFGLGGVGVGGSGGDGWYGGGSGGSSAWDDGDWEVGPGGGGSSYIIPTAQNIDYTNGTSTTGLVVITYLNTLPTITLNTTNNRTLYENDTFVIDGQATDSDNGNIVNVKYQIGTGTVRAIATAISDGTTPISFNEQLTFKNGKLFKGATEITGALTEGTTHQLKVWSEDDKGGKSTEQVRTFYVVPNRAPAITVDSISNKTDLITSDKLTISGNTSDPDGNDVVVKYKINSGLLTQIHSGPAGSWSFELSVKDLVNGENSIVVEVTDTYNFKTSKTIKLNKAANLTPLSESVQRYKIVSPTGSAQGVLLWIQRSEDLEVSAEISMTNGSEQERFVPLIRNDEDTNPNPQPAPVSIGFVEDYFKYRADALAEHIVLKLTLKGNKPITLISGALLQ